MNRPKIVVIIISYNGEPWIETCIKSILKNNYNNLEIVVVDNASQDRTTSIARKIDNHLVLFELRKNIGYGRGANVGIRYALSINADYILLLNQDIILEENCIERLVKALEEDNNIGIASPLQMTYDGSRMDPAFESLLVSGRNVENKKISFNALKNTHKVDTIIGATVFFRNTIFKVIGYFDPIFFLYHEEADLCRRARYHGIQIHIVNGARIFHWHTQLKPNYMNFRSKLSSLYGYYFFILKDPFMSIRRNILSMIMIMYNWIMREKNLKKIIKRIIINFIAVPIVIIYLPLILIKRQVDMKRRDIS